MLSFLKNIQIKIIHIYTKKKKSDNYLIFNLSAHFLNIASFKTPNQVYKNML